MKLKILLGCVALTTYLAFCTPVVLAEPQLVISAPITTISLDVNSLIRNAASKYGISYTDLYKTLYCESRLNPDAVGDHGTSFGVAQIHLPAHPDITKAEALDPTWAVNWAAQQFSTGGAGQWTCYGIIKNV